MNIDPKKIAKMISEDPDEVNPFDDTEDEFASEHEQQHRGNLHAIEEMDLLVKS